MIRSTLLLFISFIYSVSFAQQFYENTSLFIHMSEINAQWAKHPNACPQEKTSFVSDNDRIQTHLKYVCDYLDKNAAAHFTNEQHKKRTHLLAALREYAGTKIFPTNSYHSVRTPYFVDEDNVHCAVGYLMAYSGYDDLVAAIRRDHNYDYIEDIKTPGVQQWADEHGFLVDELKWIQPAYGPNTPIDSLSYGTNGTVNKLYTDGSNRILFTGDFTTVDQLPCAGIGYYQDNQLSCFGNGISGQVVDLLGTSQNLFVAGAIQNVGNTYPAAHFDGTVWNYLSIPGRDGATASAIKYGTSSNSFEIVISHTSIPGEQELWYYDGAGSWEKRAAFNGIVYDTENNGLGSFFGGQFDTVWVFDAGGSITAAYATNNVIIRDHNLTDWTVITGDVSSVVKTLKASGGYSMLIGGTCSAGSDEVCVTRYLNNTLQPIILHEQFNPLYAVSINTLALDYSYGKLIFGGEFVISGMTYGSRLAQYDLIYNTIYPLAGLNASVNSAVFMNQDLYFGGSFTQNGNLQLNHLARISSFLEVPETDIAGEPVVSPNPFQDKIEITGIDDDAKFYLMNMAGEVLREGNTVNGRINDLTSLPEGAYLLKLIQKNRIFVRKVIK